MPNVGARVRELSFMAGQSAEIIDWKRVRDNIDRGEIRHLWPFYNILILELSENLNGFSPGIGPLIRQARVNKNSE